MTMINTVNFTNFATKDIFGEYIIRSQKFSHIEHTKEQEEKLEEIYESVDDYVEQA